MTDREKAIVMAYTGCAMLVGDKLGIYYQYVQEKLGRSVMTHELAYKEVQDAIRWAAKEDFIALAKDNNVPRNGWISVKEKLPEEDMKVIGYTPVDGCMFVGFRKTYRYSWQDTSVCYWYILTARNSTKNITKRVTHWMPLPEPPKEDNK